MINVIKHGYLFLIFLGSVAFGQTGINTRTPDASSALDISATDKGVLLPQYELTTLTSSTSPINNPQEGALIYNTGQGVSTQPKGYYYWTGTSWGKLLANYEMDQILKVSVATLDAVVIPSGTVDRIVTFESTGIVNTIQGVSFTGGQNINLPIGTYRVDITFDCRSLNSTDGTAANFLLKNNFFAITAGLVNSANAPLTDKKVSSTISTAGIQSIQGYKFSYILKLTSAEAVRLVLNHNNGASETTATHANQAGLVVTFYKFFE